ncbi:hypothetical protein CC80DRAFT_529758 [Byssothecium circinans]|uniref:Heterokaryon incompatibility domain-containing protein n=1 Tax=Byssothecium circinans TaxID=147558 RepID=A0A6A5T8B9_9PLEO|nr:hypothetical protein CC80DRAFT_529758 [Byssothecium circinans]
MLLDPVGWKKIRRTCEIALEKYKVNYAWVDTCCINKESSAELQEAINTMFRYYADAIVCLTYLEDVGEGKKTFEKSRWFARGWTLQELIAPYHLEFYDTDWRSIGRKDTLVEGICKITKIPENVLKRDVALSKVPTAARMSWASRRETTREEDMAYCLLGIFDINMPMLYGEGDKAFIRLQEEIIQQSADMSIFLWARHPFMPSAYSGLLADSPAHFRGMHSVIEKPYFNPTEYRITNRGIRFELKLGLDGTGIRYLSLKHRFPGVNRCRIALQRVATDVYIRVNADKIYSSSDIGQTECAFYVPQRITASQCDIIEQQALKIDCAGFVLTDHFPLGCWNSWNQRFHAHATGAFLGYIEFRKPDYQPIAIICHAMNGNWSCGVDHYGERLDNLKEEVKDARALMWHGKNTKNPLAVFMDLEVGFHSFGIVKKTLHLRVSLDEGGIGHICD